MDKLPDIGVFEKLVDIANRNPLPSVLVGLCLFAFVLSASLWLVFSRGKKNDDKQVARWATLGSFLIAVVTLAVLIVTVPAADVVLRGHLRDWQKINPQLYGDLDRHLLFISSTPQGDRFYYRRKENTNDPAEMKWIVIFGTALEQCGQLRFTLAPVQASAVAPIDERNYLHVVVNLDDPGIASNRFGALDLAFRPSRDGGLCSVAVGGRRLSDEASKRACKFKVGEEVPDFPCAQSASAAPFRFIARAHAQTKVDSVKVDKALKSPDIQLRLETRREVAKQGEGALPWIEQTLLESTDDQLRTEALRILSQINTTKIKPRTLAKIISLLGDDHEPLRSAAVSYIKLLIDKDAKFGGQDVLDLADAAAKASRTPEEKERMAVSLMELHYYDGVRAFLAYEKDGGEAQYQTALASFKSALAYETHADADAKYRFTLPRWGLALLYHNRFWRLPAGDARRGAIERSLRTELEAVANARTPPYRYPSHVEAAKRCLAALTRECLDKSN